MITATEAKLLIRGRIARFIPVGEKEELEVCSLMARGLMTVNGFLHGDNGCWTTFRGAMALAEYSSPSNDKNRSQADRCVAKG